MYVLYVPFFVVLYQIRQICGTHIHVAQAGIYRYTAAHRQPLTTHDDSQENFLLLLLPPAAAACTLHALDTTNNNTPE